MKHTYTQAELRKFDRLTSLASASGGRIVAGQRVIARLHLDEFIEQHGMDKCKAMFDAIKQQEKNRSSTS